MNENKLMLISVSFITISAVAIFFTDIKGQQNATPSRCKQIQLQYCPAVNGKHQEVVTLDSDGTLTVTDSLKAIRGLIELNLKLSRKLDEIRKQYEDNSEIKTL